MKEILILRNRDSQKIIGKIFEINGELCFEFFKDIEITTKMMFNIFGGAGICVDECEFKDNDINKRFIKKGRICDFSLD